MLWGLIISFVVGAICAFRLPVLHFAVVVIVAIAGYAWFFGSGYSSVWRLLLWCVAYAALLQIGYVFSNFLFYLLYSRTGSRNRADILSVLRSKFSAD